jgi:class 3 adenylate cyclase/tetratricopeptide (TPR) repeat protein
MHGMAPVEPRRRTVTVLFSDLVDSTHLGERLDPETLRDALDRYFAASSEVIARHGGVVEKFIGDAIVAVFGLPAIHEDDALRAVRAAVEMQEALALVNDALGREFGVRLQTRTGVNTGEVVAGDPSAGQRLVTGDAVNVAARLEQSAPLGSVLIGETTYALVHAAGEFERLPPLRVKGKAEPLVVHRVGSLAAVGPEETTIAGPFVNRDRELAQLHRMLSGEQGVRDGSPILVLGEAGIGKTRLVAKALGQAALTVLKGRCLPYGDGITYWPIVQVLRGVGNIHAADDEDLAHQKLRAAVRKEIDDDVVVAPLVSLLVGVVTYPAEEVARAFRSYLGALATDRDVALLIEDVHWAEPTFLDLIEQTARLQNVPVVCTARPEFIDVVADQRRMETKIELEPLEREHTEELALSLSGSDVALEIRERLVDAAGGNPFFLEQIVSMLREQGALTLADTREGPSLSIPPSVAAVLDARLDRLPSSVRETAERAAVVGKIFYREAVEVLGRQDEDVGRALAVLQSRGFVESSPSDLPGQAAFAFRHILIHDAVYRGTLKRRRAEWHERLGTWLEDGSPAGGREEFIGFHLERAHRLRVELGQRDEKTIELAARASRLLALAGRRAAERNDASAAAGLLGRAIELLPEGQMGARVSLMVDLSLARLDAGSVAEALQTARSAEEHADHDVGLATHLRASAAAIMIEMHATNPDLEAIAARARDIEGELRRLGDPRALVEATLTLGIVDYALGQMGSSTARLSAAAELAREIGDTANRERALDWLVIAIVHGPMPVSEALRRCDEVIAAARAGSRVEASARASKGMLLAMASRPDMARDECDLSRSIYEELGMLLEVAASSQAKAAIELLAGDPAVVVDELRSDRDLLEQMNALGYRVASELRLAEALDAIGDDPGALAVIEELKNELPTTDVVGVVRAASVDVHSLVRQGRHQEAEAKAREALERAMSTDVVWLVAGALTDLADVLLELGEAAEARRLLTKAKRLYLAKENAALAGRVQTRLGRLDS